MPNWFVYIVRCSDDSLYAGISTDVTARVLTHNSGRGAKYTRARRPVNLVWKKRAKNESAARKMEMAIKKLPRIKKLDLINPAKPKNKIF
ncbi:MAG: GIY-YIG nuclease family protein [Patescibacteria group bacterium]|nr:GIY-YIG nuclease family protein [Patescibacteria group bacterium]